MSKDIQQEAKTRIEKYIKLFTSRRGCDREHIHGINEGHETEAMLTISDLKELLAEIDRQDGERKLNWLKYHEQRQKVRELSKKLAESKSDCQVIMADYQSMGKEYAKLQDEVDRLERENKQLSAALNQFSA